jgi:hypothetical protein
VRTVKSVRQHVAVYTVKATQQDVVIRVYPVRFPTYSVDAVVILIGPPVTAYVFFSVNCDHAS